MNLEASTRDTTVVIPAAGMESAPGGWQPMPKTMTPVLGKPFILYILDRLVSQGFRKFVIVENSANNSIRVLVNFVYSWRNDLELTFICQDKLIGPLDAIVRSQEHVRSDDLLIWLGDTFCRSTLDFRSDAVLVGPVEEAYRWCIAKTDQDKKIVSLFDKKSDGSGEAGRMEALAGVYYIRQARDFFSVARSVMAGAPAHTGYYELSQALSRYMADHPIEAVPIVDWVDVGNQDMLLSTLGQLLAPRAFNNLVYHPETNVIRKTTDDRNSNKLRNEIFWLTSVPMTCQRFIPQVVDSSIDMVDTSLSLEFVSLPSLASIYTFQRLPLEKWEWVIAKVLKVFSQNFWSQKKSHPKASDYFYSQVVDKLHARLADYPEFLPAREPITVDGVRYEPLQAYLPQFENAVKSLSRSFGEMAVVHGDLCFSNILFDLGSGLFKVIDPKGSFGSESPSIYGHPIYDLAKLRHSIAGGYDSLAANMFHLSVEGKSGFRLSIHQNPAFEGLTAYFDNQVQKLGFDLRLVRFVEASLFLSMPPLHSENPHRQRAMYFIGLRKLVEALG